jgi:hypothetical protein
MLGNGGRYMGMLGQMSDKRDKSTLKTTIEENLRRVYTELLDEEVPDRFKALLDQLRATQTPGETPPGDQK